MFDFIRDILSSTNIQTYILWRTKTSTKASLKDKIYFYPL